jgi:hypothetical protein
VNPLAVKPSADESPPETPTAGVLRDGDEIFLSVTDLPPDFIDRWILAVPRKTVRLRLLYRDGRLLLAVGGLPRVCHEALEKWLACRKREIFCG